MRRAWGVVLALAIFGGAPSVGHAQPQTLTAEVTVDELVARALAESPDVLAARADADAAKGRLVQAGLRPNPMLELGGQKALGTDNNVMVGLSIPLDLNRRKEGGGCAGRAPGPRGHGRPLAKEPGGPEPGGGTRAARRGAAPGGEPAAGRGEPARRRPSHAGEPRGGLRGA